MNAAVFLDRDNTLIHNDGDLGEPDKVQLIQGVASAVASLAGLGYKVVVITNQGGVARGKYAEEDVDAVHRRISELLQAAASGAKIDRFYYCPYHPGGTIARYRKEHPNRKPAPGMLLEAARDIGLDLKQSWTIGDQIRDIQAGIAAGTRTILLRRDADRLKPFDPREHPGLVDESDQNKTEKAAPDFFARNLVEAVRIVAQQRKPETSETIHRTGKGQRRWDAAAVARLQKENKAARSAASTVSQNLEPQTQAPKPAAAAADTKPFRPWNAPSDEEADKPTPDVTVKQVAPAAKPDRKPKQAQEPPQPTTAEPDQAPTPSPPAQKEPNEKTLRLILQELRNQRGQTDDFSYTRIMAIVLQTLAGACLLGAFWMGSGDSAMYMKLAGAAIFIELAVIAAVLWDRR